MILPGYFPFLYVFHIHGLTALCLSFFSKISVEKMAPFEAKGRHIGLTKNNVFLQSKSRKVYCPI